MKQTIFILMALLFAATANSQSFKKETTTANLGIGLGTALGGLGNARPAISLSIDHGLWETGGPGVISLGGYVGNTGYKYSSGGYNYKWNYIVAGVRGAYHYNGFTNLPKLDPYAGAMLGYNIVKYSSDAADDIGMAKSYGSGIGFSGFIGSRWFFTENIGAYAELGYGVSVLNVGATYKF